MKKTIRQRITVNFQYPVAFTRGVFDQSNRLLARTLSGSRKGAARALVVIDQGLADATPGLPARIEEYFRQHDEKLELPRAPLVVPGGENAKNDWGAVREIIRLAGELRLDRHSYLVAVGGGSVLDMAGLAAALIHRGLRLVRLPSTVLAQNDAGVGVKNSMNAADAKNFVGTFAPPFAVINDYNLLKTLPQREWIGGVSEAFKVAILKDRAFFDYLCRHAADLRGRRQDVMERVVYQTAAMHLHHIATSGDPFEFGSARPLDFGHWAAHRLELLSDFSLGHGQAVAVGIALDSTYAYLKRMLAREEHEAIIAAMRECGLPVWTPLLECGKQQRSEELLEGLEQFREHLGGRLCITLPLAIGGSREVRRIDTPLMLKAVALLKDLT